MTHVVKCGKSLKGDSYSWSVGSSVVSGVIKYAVLCACLEFLHKIKWCSVFQGQEGCVERLVLHSTHVIVSTQICIVFQLSVYQVKQLCKQACYFLVRQSNLKVIKSDK